MKNLICEQFLTIQGEGRTIGKLAYFLRLAGCNLRCRWCDSMHAVDPKLFKGKTFPVAYDKIPEYVELIVISGGEPTLFNLVEMKKHLKTPNNPFREIEVESNATNFPNYVDEFNWNLSPKLKSSEQANKAYDDKRLVNLHKWAEYARSTKPGGNVVIFKFVVSNKLDLLEIEDLVRTLEIPRQLVYLQAEGYSKESQQADKVGWLVSECTNRGFNFGPRLHVMLWGNERGK